MTQQPEALRLADALDLYATGDAYQRDIEQAADELRRLHSAYAELLEVLKDATEGLEIASAGGGVDFYAYAKTARAAINSGGMRDG